MVRDISATALTKLQQNLGSEPVVILKIQWVKDGDIYVYADKDINANEGRILEVSGLDNTVVVQGVSAGVSGDSQAISITLDDTDGSIKEIIDTHDIHKQPVWVFQWFTGLDPVHEFLIFKGQVSSPIQWNEGDRSVSFDVITRIEDAEVGFSMEEGDFEWVPEDLIGKSWPLCFGTVINVPGLRTRTPRTGILKQGFGIADPVLPAIAEQEGETCCPMLFDGFSAINEGPPHYSLRLRARYTRDVACECNRLVRQCTSLLNYAEQVQYQPSTIEIINGSLFPQNVWIVLEINGSHVAGFFTGDIFSVGAVYHPRFVQGDTIPPIRDFRCPATEPTNNRSNTVPIVTCTIDDCDDVNSPTQTSFVTVNTTQEKESFDYLSQFERWGFFWAEAGTEISVVGEDELVYVANILPSTVHSVKAWKTFPESGYRQLTLVPTEYYTVRISDFDVYQVTEVVLSQPLSSRDSGWEDDIFITLTSSVGPNTVDEMLWLIQTYTNLGFDLPNFISVQNKLEKYPMHFMVPGRMNILDLLQEMAFQNRCALTLRNDQFELTYLSDEPNQDETITESDVIMNSLILDHTDTEELVTKFVAEWYPFYHIDDPYKIVLRHNGEQYGMHERVYDFFCFNIQELVHKSATFWMIRMANTWRKIRLQTPINKLVLEAIDGVYVTLPDIADGEIKCRVETAVYNSDDNAIDMEIWTPLVSGTRTPYNFAYPADVDYREIFPTIEEMRFGAAGSGGPNVNVTPPEGHVLGSFSPSGFSGFSFGQLSPCAPLSNGGPGGFWQPQMPENCRPDHGDAQPSDQDDTKPEPNLTSDNAATPPNNSPRDEIGQSTRDIESQTIQNEGNNAQTKKDATNALQNGTGSTTGAGNGINPGAGSLSDDAANGEQGYQPDKEGVLDYLENLPDQEELDDLGACYWGLIVFFIQEVTSVTICPGDSCDPPGQIPEFECAEPDFCYCGEEGKEGCVVGNQVPNKQEKFMFDTQAARDSMAQAIAALTSASGKVGAPHPVFTAGFQSTPAECPQLEPGYTEKGIIGYEGSGTDATVVDAADGFMTNPDYSNPPTCGC